MQKGHACRQAGFGIIYIIVGILILGLVAGGAYYLGKSFSSLPAPSASTPPNTTPTQLINKSSSDSTANWQTYSKENYTFKYPTGATASTTKLYSMLSKGEDEGLSIKPPYQAPYNKWYEFDLVVRDNPQSLDAKTIVNTYISELQVNCSQPACSGLKMMQDSLKEYKNENISGFIFKIGAETESSMVVSVKDNRTYIFRMTGDNGNINENGKIIFDQILSTFKFTSP